MVIVVRRMNEVTLRRARLVLVLGWVTVFGYTITVRNDPTRSTQPCIRPESLNREPASAGVNAGMSPRQVTLCDPIWHVNSIAVWRLRSAKCYIRVTLFYFKSIIKQSTPSSGV